MGHSVPPLMLLLLLLLLLLSPASPCFTVPSDAPAELDLSNRSQGCPELDWSLFARQRQLQLSHNGIAGLRPSAQVAPGLKELDLSHNGLRGLPAAFLSQARGLQQLQLQYNELQELPRDFFANATALRSLRLEGNPLPAVPSSAFQPSLQHLVVSCRCDVVGSILAPCSCSQSQCTAPQCHCLTSHRNFSNVTDFHSRECGISVGLAAGLAVATAGVVTVLVVTAVACYRWRKAAISAAGVGWGKREPVAAHGQPRYISRAAETGTSEMGTTEMGTTEVVTAPDYENVFVNPCNAPAARGWASGWQEERDRDSPQVPVDDDYFLESERDQPIYANTQSPSEDNLYIIPDRP